MKEQLQVPRVPDESRSCVKFCPLERSGALFLSSMWPPGYLDSIDRRRVPEMGIKMKCLTARQATSERASQPDMHSPVPTNRFRPKKDFELQTPSSNLHTQPFVFYMRHVLSRLKL